jgi:hypothetical protein
MRRKFKIMFLATLLGGFMAIGLGQPAKAQLTAGAVNPVTGLPSSYGDASGLSLGVCEDGIAAGTPCIGELVNPALGFVQGNIAEDFYYDASASIDILGAGPLGTDISLLSICAIEGISDATGESVLNRGRVDLRNLAPLTSYTVTTPCLGTFTETSDDRGRLFFTIDALGLPETVPPFGGVGFRNGPVQSFASNGTGAPGFLGDAVTAAPLQSELRPGGGLIFQVTGPLVPAGTQTPDFTVVGKIFSLAPVAPKPPPVTWTLNRAGIGTLDFKFAAPPFSVTAEVVGVPTAIPNVVEPFQLTLAGGRFTGSIPIVAADVLPTEVEVTFNRGIAGETPPPVPPGQLPQRLPVTEKKVGLPGIPLLLEE